MSILFTMHLDIVSIQSILHTHYISSSNYDVILLTMQLHVIGISMFELPFFLGKENQSYVPIS